MRIAAFIEETANVHLVIFGTGKNASFIQYSAQLEHLGLDQAAHQIVNADKVIT